MWVDAIISRDPDRRDGNNLVFESHGTEDWQRLQEGADERYALPDYNSPTDLEVSALFGDFIAAGLPRNAVVLDVGCGPFAELQPYAVDLSGVRYLGLEPILATPKRSYPCLVGPLAESIPLKDASVDAAVFATSLDHIVDEDSAMKEIGRVLKPDGRVLIWQGRYDPRSVARQKTYEPVFFGHSRPKMLARVLVGTVENLVTGWRIIDRKRKLERGVRLDNAHARYYTPEMLKRSASRWGTTIRRWREVPGSTALFVDLRFS